MLLDGDVPLILKNGKGCALVPSATLLPVVQADDEMAMQMHAWLAWQTAVLIDDGCAGHSGCKADDV